MKIDLNEILYAVSAGLDAVEHELIGIRKGHCKRIAAMSIMLGKAIGLSPDDLVDLAAFSILHDNALTQVNQEEIGLRKYNAAGGYSVRDFNFRRCVIGEQNTKYMPFRTNNRDVILLHHENADGSGPQGRTYDRTPIKAQIIHLSDCLDNNFDLTAVNRDNYGAIIYYVKSNSGSMFSKEIVDCFTKFFKVKHLNNLTFTNIDNFLSKATKHFNDEYTPQEVYNLATLLAMIIDFKSHYTCKHSSGVAVNCKKMAEFYKFPPEKLTKFYLAGALHDVGKLMIPNEILQKPGKLDDREYEIMKQHVVYTYEILKNIKGMNDILIWAAHHHEKLDGSGYPFGLTKDDLSMEERLMTCCDIYQALTEERAYKAGFSHEKAIEIMRGMVIEGKIDNSILLNMDHVFANKEWDRSIPTSILTSS
ncbi:MAG: HD domain-containing protein [Eubacterium sp.]|nr:HD domain-containing protein [Eubacterium sp.]